MCVITVFSRRLSVFQSGKLIDEVAMVCLQTQQQAQSAVPQVPHPSRLVWC